MSTQYNSYSNTKSKLPKVLENLNQIKAEVDNLPNFTVKYDSLNFLKDVSVVKILSNETGGFAENCFTVTLENFPDSMLFNVKFFAVGYKNTFNEITYIDNIFREIWERRSNNVVVTLGFYFFLEEQRGHDSGFRPNLFYNLYMINNNSRNFYNV